MRVAQKCSLPALVCWLMPGLLTICSLAVVAQPSAMIRSDHIGKQNKSYRNIGNTEFSGFFSESMTLPADTCAIVDHIEQIGLTNETNSSTDARIKGAIALSAGRKADKAFYANVDIPASQGYHPPQRNIAKTEYFRIYLATHSGNLHVVTQSFPPRFVPGNTVLLRNSGLLEIAEDCMHKPEPR